MRMLCSRVAIPSCDLLLESDYLVGGARDRIDGGILGPRSTYILFWLLMLDRNLCPKADVARQHNRPENIEKNFDVNWI